jgi:tRNA-guanine family transglycosylase
LTMLDSEERVRCLEQCAAVLPDHKPRYLMGVGYPLDLVICTALGVDMWGNRTIDVPPPQHAYKWGILGFKQV